MCTEVLHRVTGFSIDLGSFKVVFCCGCKESLPTFFKFIVKVTKAKDFVGSTHYIWLVYICGFVFQWQFSLWLPPVKSYLVHSGRWLLYAATCINIKTTAFSTECVCVFCVIVPIINDYFSEQRQLFDLETSGEETVFIVK